MHNDNTLNRNQQHSQATNSNINSSRKKSSSSTGSVSITPSTTNVQSSRATGGIGCNSSSSSKKIDQFHDLIQACLNEQKQVSVAKDWCPQITNQTDLHELSAICKEKLRPGENLPIYFTENGLNIHVNLLDCETIFYNNNLIVTFNGKVLLNQRTYLVAGEIYMNNELRGYAHLKEQQQQQQQATTSRSLELNDETAYAGNIKRTDSCSNLSNVATVCENDLNERFYIKQEIIDIDADDDDDDDDDDGDDYDQQEEKYSATMMQPSNPTTSAGATNVLQKQPWSKKSHFLTKYNDN